MIEEEPKFCNILKRKCSFLTKKILLEYRSRSMQMEFFFFSLSQLLSFFILINDEVLLKMSFKRVFGHFFDLNPSYENLGHFFSIEKRSTNLSSALLNYFSILIVNTKILKNTFLRIIMNIFTSFHNKETSLSLSFLI